MSAHAFIKRDEEETKCEALLQMGHKLYKTAGLAISYNVAYQSSYINTILTDFNYATLTSPYIFQKNVECKLPLLQ